MSTLRELHRKGDPLVLPNVWDAASALVVARAGLPAIATSSAAMAESLGYADGEKTPVAEMLDAIARVVSAVDVPVTADFERGYGLKPAELVERLAATGIAGCNLEDSDKGAREQADFLASVRAAGPELVLNARIDTTSLPEAIRRASLYRQAGADCVFPIFLSAGDLPSFVSSVDSPVNALYRPGGRTLSELANLGVARISYGPGLFRAMQAHLATLIVF